MKFSRNIATVAVALALLAACAPEAKEDPAVSAMRAAAEADSQKLDAVNTLIEVWDTNEVDRLDAIAVSDYVRRAPDQDADSLDELKAFIGEVHSVYPDFSITNDGAAAGPAGVFVKWTVTGTYMGEGARPETGSPVNLSGISLYQFKDGKIFNELVIFDSGALSAQIAASE